jgi:hypothetical protein
MTNIRKFPGVLMPLRGEMQTVLLLGWFSLWSLNLGAQTFDLKSQSVQVAIKGTNYSGYSTAVDFPKKEVLYGWWKYARRYGKPLNQRTHYEVTLPATDKTKALVLYTIVKESGTGSVVELALNTEGMGEEDKKKYQAQVRDVLLDFKRWYYLRYYENQLEKLAKKLPKNQTGDYSPWVEFYNKREEVLKVVRGI